MLLKLRGKNNKFILGLIIIHLVFFVTKIWIGDYFIVDSYEYYQLSENIFNHFEFYCGDLNGPIDFRNYNRRPPLYSIFILGASFFLKSTICILLFQNILSIISLVLLKNIFEKTFFGINHQLFFIFIITSVSQFIYCNLVMSEVFFQFLIVLLFYSLYDMFKAPSWKKLIIFQVLIAFIFLTKPVFYLFIFPNVLLTVMIYKKTKIKLGFLSAIIPISIFVLYCFWNFNRTGSADFSSMQNFNLLEWNLKYFHQNKYGQEKALMINDSILASVSKIDSYSEKQSYIKNEAIQYLKKDLIGYAIFHAKGSIRMFIDPGRFDLFSFFNVKSKNPARGILYHINESGLKGAFEFLRSQPLFIFITFFVVLFFNVIKFISFIWFWIKNYRKANFVILTILCVILYLVILTGPLGASRFFVPILPAYLAISVLGFTDVVNCIKKQKLKIIKGY